MNAEVWRFVRHPIMKEMLQWSRVHVNAEVRELAHECVDLTPASMEPRSRERGSRTRTRGLRRAAAASMEPRSRERGSFPVALEELQVFFASMEPRSRERGSKTSST